MNTTPLSSEHVVQQGLDFLNLSTGEWYEVVIRLNWIFLVIVIIVACVATWVIRSFFNKRTGRRITLDGVSFGIGEFKCELTCGNEVQEIAYQLWVELITRKIAIPLEEEDVIIDIYDSWYAAFSAIRELLKTVPGKCLEDASDLIDITTNVLNEGLRPHLTKWQAKYRVWYDLESKGKEESPQDIQKRYPEYEQLLSDMKETNQHMINFAQKMHEIAFGK